MEEEKKNKLKKILSYIGCGIGCFILGLCVSNCANNKGKKASNVNNNTQNEVVQNVERKNVAIDEDGEVITFNLVDITYTWVHFNVVFIEQITSFNDGYVIYQGHDYTFDDNGGNYVSFVYDAGGVSPDMIQFNEDGSIDYLVESTTSISFVDSFDVVSLIDDFSLLVNAIEEDIKEHNQQYQQSIFGGLTESLVDFIGVIGSGFTSVFTIFYASGHITTFGTLSLIVVGVAIAYFLFRFIIGLIRLRG